MTSWQDVLAKSPIEWLLEKENPSVRYFTLRDLLDRTENDSELEEAKAAISTSKVVAKMLSKQKSDGYWEHPDSPYLPKYKSTYWQVMILGQLGMDKNDKRVQRACGFIFNLQLNEGGFSAYTRKQALARYDWMRTRIVLKEEMQPEPEDWVQSIVKEHQYSCLTGNICTAMLRMDYWNDSRLDKALNWLVKIQNSDGGWLCPYWKAHIKDVHSCFYGTTCSLEAFSEVPKTNCSSAMKHAIEKGAEFLLMHKLFEADHHGYKVINQRWLKFSFPWFYEYHVLRGLLVLTKLGYIEDERLIDAVEVLLQKRRQDGTWLLDSAPIGRMQANIETVGKPSKWVTLNALKVLKRLYQTSNKQIIEMLVKI
jgi:prenyltransferase beta subunit